jgi:hypothetical protein
VAYQARLESVCSRKVTVGSNPTLSASLRQGYGWQATGNVDSTKNRTPLFLEAYFAINNNSKAIELERYLKTGSGKALLHKRIL